MKKYTKSHTLQLDQTDCGVACLKSILRYYGGDASLEKLREWSGTSVQGTTLLGLQEASVKVGLESEAFEVDNLDEFKMDASFPCILHVLIDNKLQHYVVCYKIEGTNYLIGDPATGVSFWPQEKVLEVWKSRLMLNVKPTERIELISNTQKRKLLWFLNLIKPDIPLLGSSVALGVVIATLGLTTAYFTQKLIDDFLPNKQMTKVFSGLGLLLVLLLIRSGINYLRTLIILLQNKEFNVRTASNFFNNLLYLPKTFFDNRKIGDLITRMNDTRRIQATILTLTNSAIIDILIILISVIYIFSFSWLLGGIMLAAIPLYVLIVLKYTEPITLSQREVMGAYGSTESNYIDTISGISAIKSYNRQIYFSENTKRIYTVFQHKSILLGFLGNRYGTFSQIVGTLVLLAVLGLCSYLVINNNLKTGEMMAVVSIAGGVIGSIGSLANVNIQIQEAIVAFDRMFEFTDTKAEDQNGLYLKNNETIRSIKLNKIGFKFPGRKYLFNDFSLTLKRGQFTLLKGEVGKGKSVLLNLIQRNHEPSSGEIVLNEAIKLNDVNLFDWRSKIGIVEQDVKIFNGTILDNIILGKDIVNSEKLILFFKELDFEDIISGLPNGLHTLVGESGLKLSGGQKQLVGLARALYSDPDVLLLDEPTAALDIKSSQKVLRLINNLKNDKIILMVTHDENLEADQTYYL